MARATDLATWLAASEEDISLVDLSFTLAVGRAQLEERLAFQANSLEDVNAGLDRFLKGLIADSILVSSSLTLEKTDVANPGREWVSGVPVDWVSLFAGLNPIRLHLPTYSFARDRHWYDLLEEKFKPVTRVGFDQENRLAEVRTGPNRTVRLKNLDEGSRLLSESPPPVTAPHDLDRLAVNQVGPIRHQDLKPTIRPTSDQSSNDRQDTEAVTVQVRRLVAGVLYLGENQVLNDKKFADMGLDSILAVELVKRINSEVGLNIPSATLYSYPTVQQLATHIAGLRLNEPPGETSSQHTRVAPVLSQNESSEWSIPLTPTDPSEIQNPRRSVRRTLIRGSGTISDLELSAGDLEAPDPGAGPTA